MGQIQIAMRQVLGTLVNKIAGSWMFIYIVIHTCPQQNSKSELLPKSNSDNWTLIELSFHFSFEQFTLPSFSNSDDRDSRDAGAKGQLISSNKSSTKVESLAKRLRKKPCLFFWGWLLWTTMDFCCIIHIYIYRYRYPYDTHVFTSIF